MTIDDTVEDLLGDDVWPVGNTGAPIYNAVWLPGEPVPSSISVTTPGDDVDLITIAAHDTSFFAALLSINSAESATEFRFDNAVPENHTAVLQDDGSVAFFDAVGASVEGIAVPWALDANGEEIPTSYALDGTTLVQTVEHHGAAYPVYADPNWGKVFAGAVTALSGIATISVTWSSCPVTGASCVAAASSTPYAGGAIVRGGLSMWEGMREPSRPARPRPATPRICRTSPRTGTACPA